MIAYEEALRRLLAHTTRLGSEFVELAQARGVLAEDIVAQLAHPRCDESAMDGYAVRAEDVASAGEETVWLPLFGESRAGAPSKDALPPAHAMRIFTGAALPAGANAIVVQEDTRTDAQHPGQIGLRFPAQERHHVRARGSSCRAGDVLAGAGTPVHGGVVAVAASQGFERISVHRSPRVHLLSTGDELVDVGKPLHAGSLYDSNGPMLAHLARSLGARVRRSRAADDDAALATSIEGAFDAHAFSADLLITAGGASVGDYDRIRPILRKLGVAFDFEKVAIKPGKPVTFGTLEREGRRCSVLALPGNPVSAFVTFHLFARPLLRALQGQAPIPPRRLPLAVDVRHRTGRDEFMRAAYENGCVRPFARQNSGAMHDLARAQCLVRLDGEREQFNAGEPVPVYPLISRDPSG